MVRRHIVDNDLEEKILTGLIISDKICRDTHRLIRKDTFQNPYTQTISKWVVNYYKKYGKAPRTQIQDIFNVESAKLKEGEEPLIASFLSRLSSELEKEENLNEDYLIDRAILYIKKRTLKNISEKIDSYLEMDKLEDAEMELQSYQQVERDSSKFINPFSDETITKFFEDHNNNANNMFRMPGALGDLIGDFERSTLVGIMGPAKRGKSFLLMEIAFQAFLERYKVLFVSLEMSQYKMERRILSRITAMGEEERDFVLPCFDCYRNQMNICNKSERTCHTRLRNDKGEKPTEFHPSSRYVVCTACRGTDDFFMDSWFTTIHKKKRTRTNSKNIAKGLLQMYDDN
jgi:replicative DNA helicase